MLGYLISQDANPQPGLARWQGLEWTMIMTTYTDEYKRLHCVQCGKLLSEHRRFTAADIEATRLATYQRPINGYYAPLSPTLIGEWTSHTPMPWRTT